MFAICSKLRLWVQGARMYGAAASWIEALPARWALGGTVLGVAWAGLSVLVGGAPRPSAPFAALVSLLLLIVLPVGILGFGWGWHERHALREALAEGPAAIAYRMRNGYLFIQVGKGALCGFLFGLFQLATGATTARPGTEDIIANLVTLAAPLIVGAVVGLGIGVMVRSSLRRRLPHLRDG